MTFLLVLYEGDRAVRRVPAVDRLVIGRGDGCALQLSDSSVSSRHAQIVEERGELLIEDLGSHNKTVVERGPVLGKGQRVPLRHGMALVLGRIRVTVEEEARPTPAATPAGSGGLPELEQTVPELTLPDATLPEPASLDGGDATPAASSRSVPPPIPARSGEPTPTLSSDSATLVPQSSSDPALAAHAFIKGLRPRLVVDNDAIRKVVELGSNEFTIGRKEGALTLNHPRVSSPHARIFYEAELERMFLEDLGSKNGTFLDGELLKPGVPREIPPEAHLRFGTLDALFLLEKCYDGETLEVERSKAIELLSRLKKTNPAQEQKARGEASGKQLPLGAALVLTGAITAAQWVKALADARIVLVTDAVVGRQIRRLEIWSTVLFLAFLALLALTLLQMR